MFFSTAWNTPLAFSPHLVAELSILTSPGRAGRSIIPDQLEIYRSGCKKQESQHRELKIKLKITAVCRNLVLLRNQGSIQIGFNNQKMPEKSLIDISKKRYACLQ